MCVMAFKNISFDRTQIHECLFRTFTNKLPEASPGENSLVYDYTVIFVAYGSSFSQLLGLFVFRAFARFHTLA